MVRTAGIDVGTGAVKVAIAESDAGALEGARMLALVQERIRRRDLNAVIEETFRTALVRASESGGDAITKESLDYIATTGEGDSIPFRTGHFYGMTTHSRGALFLDREARGAVDIGALHARAMRFDEHGRVRMHRMTSQCASGTGQFLENIARYLGVSVDEIGELSLAARAPEKPSGICAVLAETDVINMVSRGIETEDILRGIHESMAQRLGGLVRATKVDGVLMLTGGLSRDDGLVAALRDRLAEGGNTIEVRTHPDAVFAAAIGAALWGAFRHGKLAGADEVQRAGGRHAAV
jgi:benzoyl-CoA reductase subunit D